jgi:hypothetical protein
MMPLTKEHGVWLLHYWPATLRFRYGQDYAKASIAIMCDFAIFADRGSHEDRL